MHGDTELRIDPPDLRLRDRTGVAGLAASIGELTDELEADWRERKAVSGDVARRLRNLRSEAERLAGFES